VITSYSTATDQSTQT